MGYIFTFIDNDKVTSAQLNGIKSDIGVGVAVGSNFTDGVEYFTDKLNEIRQDIVTKGIKDGCACTKTNDTTVKINAGMAFFDSGVKIEIDSNGIELSVSPGTDQYIYLTHDHATNFVGGTVVNAPLTTGDYVYIAKLLANGTIEDNRYWCRSKIAMMNSRVTQKLEINIKAPLSTSQFTKAAEFNLENKGYSRIFVFNAKFFGSAGLYNRDTQKYTWFEGYRNGEEGLNESEDMRIYHNSGVSYARIKFIENNGKIEIHARAYSSPYTTNLLLEVI